MNTMILWLLGACGEKTVTVRNSEPEAIITSHQAGESVYAGIPIALRGAVSDANHLEDELVTHWFADNRELCMNVQPLVDGLTSCENAELLEGESIIRLQVVDPMGATSITELPIEVQPYLPPEIEWFQPLADAMYFIDSPISIQVHVSDPQDNPEDLVLEWESSIDGPLELTEQSDSNGIIEEVVWLSEGEHLFIRVKCFPIGKITYLLQPWYRETSGD